MERNFTEVYKSGTSAGSSGAQTQQTTAEPHQFPFPKLRALAEILRDVERFEDILARFPEPLGLDQLEMLEAELLNQGILTRSNADTTTLSQHVTHESNIWRWRAERSGVVVDLDLYVDIPRYTLAKAAELLENLTLTEEQEQEANSDKLLQRKGTWRPSVKPAANLISDLRYLDRFASYVMGEFENGANRYQRGLNVVLRALRGVRSRAERIVQLSEGDLVEISEPVLICLPISKEEFFERLQEARKEDL